MYPQHLKYLQEKGLTWFDPCYGLSLFWAEYNKIKEKTQGTSEYVWSHRDLKRAKEIYAISIIAKAMSKSDGNRWWITKPKADPPDGVIGTIIKKGDIEEMQVREVEVVEHIGGNIVDTITKKLSGKSYEPNTALVCYVSQSDPFDPEQIFQELSKIHTSLDHIFLVFTGVKVSEVKIDSSKEDFVRSIYKIASIQVKPVYSYVQIDPLDDCKEWRAGVPGSYFTFLGRGKGGAEKITLENPPKLF